MSTKGIIKAYALPHPPIVLPPVGRGEEKKIQKTFDAMDRAAREIAEAKPDTIIITSPHAPGYQDGFFFPNSETVEGDFGRFGLPELRQEVAIDQELIERIQELAGDIAISAPAQSAYVLDHAAFVPLYFIHQYYQDFKVVLSGLSGLPGDSHYQLGTIIEKALSDLGRKTIFVASGDLSHVLKEAGPYGYREEGPAFDQKIIGILQEANFEDLLSISPQEMDAAAQCGTPSFQIMAGAMDGRSVQAELYSYEGSFGVGYGVVAFTPGATDEDRRFLKR